MTLTRRANIRTDTHLTKISVGYKNLYFAFKDIFPQVKVKKNTGTFVTWNKDSMRTSGVDRSIARGGKSKEVDFDVGSETYTCLKYGNKVRIPREDIRDADEVFNLLEDDTENLTHLEYTLREKALATKLITTGNYASGLSGTISIKWDDYTSSDPITDLKAGFTAIRDQIGLYPNTLLFSFSVWASLCDHPQLIERMKYTKFDSLKPGDMSTFLPNIKKVIIADAVDVTSDEGQTTITQADIWGQQTIAAYVSPVPGKKQASFGYTFMLDGGQRIRRWYDEDGESYIIDFRWEYGDEFICRDGSDLAIAGYLYDDCIT